MEDPALETRTHAPAWTFALAGFLFATALLELLPHGPSEAALRARLPEGFLEERPPQLASASPRELRTLPGIGETRALAIARARFEQGTLSSPDELERIRGIGPATVERVRAALELPRR